MPCIMKLRVDFTPLKTLINFTKGQTQQQCQSLLHYAEDSRTCLHWLKIADRLFLFA